VALSAAYGEALKGAASHTAQTVKLAEAVKAGGEAAVSAAELTGNEVAVLEARAAAADKNAAAAQNVTAARSAELATLQSQLVALQEEGERTGQLTEAKKNQLKALQELIEQKGVEVQKSQELASTLAAEAKAAQAAAYGIEAAFSRLGVTSSAKLKQLADNAKADFERIRESGVATPRELQQAWIGYAEKAIAANGGVASAALKAEAAIYKVRIEADATGKAIVRAADSGREAMAGLKAEAQQVADSIGLIKRQASGLSGVWDENGDLIDGPRGDSRATRISIAGRETILNRAESLGGLALRKKYEELLAEQSKFDKLDSLSSSGWTPYIKRLNRISDELDKLQIEQERATGRYETNRPQVTETRPREQITAYRVEIGLGGGRKSSINTADKASADALVDLLRQLEADRSRS